MAFLGTIWSLPIYPEKFNLWVQSRFVLSNFIPSVSYLLANNLFTTHYYEEM